MDPINDVDDLLHMQYQYLELQLMLNFYMKSLEELDRHEDEFYKMLQLFKEFE